VVTFGESFKEQALEKKQKRVYWVGWKNCRARSTM